MSNITKAVGQQIKMYRAQNDLTQEKLAEMADLHVSHIFALEKGTKSATIDSLKKIADSFNLSLSQFFAFDSKTDDLHEYQLHMALHECAVKIIEIYNK